MNATDYLRLSYFASASNAQVRLALTATATKRVAKDILERLDIKTSNTVQLPSIRNNLLLSVKSFSYPYDTYEQKLKTLLHYLPLLTNGGSAIIYVNKQQLAEKLAKDLLKKGYNTRAYHSGIPNREEVEQWFLRKNDIDIIPATSTSSSTSTSKIKDGKSLSTPISSSSSSFFSSSSPIVVGTTAFGMGIDKSDVRSVIHFDLSRSVEDYVQGYFS